MTLKPDTQQLPRLTLAEREAIEERNMRAKPMTADDLKAWRAGRGLTQEAVAKVMNTPLATYKNWESTRNRIPGAIKPLTEFITKEYTRA